jgi:hypothetical protein
MPLCIRSGVMNDEPVFISLVNTGDETWFLANSIVLVTVSRQTCHSPV